MLNIESIISDAMETCMFDWDDEVITAVDEKVNEIVGNITTARWRDALKAAVERRASDIEDMINDTIEDYVQEKVDDYVD